MKLSRTDIQALAVALADELHSRGAKEPLDVAHARDVARYIDEFPDPCTSGGFVYFARCLDSVRAVKIGQTQRLAGRMSTLQIGCPHAIVCLGWYWTTDPKAEEQALHSRFAAQHIRGEWFAPSPELERLMDEVNQLRREELNERRRAIARLLTS